MNSSARRSSSRVVTPGRTFSSSILRQPRLSFHPHASPRAPSCSCGRSSVFLSAYGPEDVFCDLRDLLLGVDRNEEVAVGVVVFQRLGLVVVDLQPATDGFLGVVIALDERAWVILGGRIILDVVDLARSLTLAPSRESLYERVVGRFEGYHGVEILADFFQGLIQGLRLGLVAGETVEDP